MLQPSSRSPFDSRKFAAMAEDEARGEPGEASPESGPTARGSALPPGLAALAAEAKRRPQKGRNHKALIFGSIGFVVAVLAMQALLPGEGTPGKRSTKSFMPSILKDVGHVITIQKGVGIER